MEKVDVQTKADVSEKFIAGFDGQQIFTRTWDKVNKPKAVMMILHGMVEHSGRYQDFAQKCNNAGIIVFCMDLRGHGRTVGDSKKVGKYTGDLFGDCVKDAQKFADELIATYKLPLIVFGHSFGSFLTQEFIQNYHKHAMVILSGSANMGGVSDVKLGKMVANIQKFFCGKDSSAKLIYKLSFGKYRKSFDNGNWLTRDDAMWDKYIADPYCGNICSAQFYSSFFGHLNKLYKDKGIQNIDKNIPILITSGEKDPVGGEEHKLVDKLDKLYRQSGIQHITYRLWEDCRHEILNESNRDEIVEYILEWIHNNLNK